MIEKIKNKLANLFLTSEITDGGILVRHYKNLWAIGSFLISFVVILVVTNNYLQRRAAISTFKNNFDFLLSSINDSGWDIAYDKIEFGRFYPSNLITFKNFKIYKLNDNPYKELNLSELKINNGFFSPKQLSIKLAPSAELNYAGKNHKIVMGDYHIEVEMTGNESLNNLTANINDLKISDWADIEKINYAARIIAPQQINDQSPFLKNYLKIENIKLNGLLDYPLSQNISRIYMEADIIGQIKKADTIKTSLNEWLARDGKIEIKNFTINWLPLLLVGKGDLYFNDNLQPIMKMNTSSKALINLLDQLEQKKWLDSKGVFVAKILLNNKAYKADQKDQFLTVSTPIAIQEDALLVQKIPVKKWKN